MSYKGILEPEHLEKVREIRARKIAAGLSTERCDRKASEAAIKAVYTFVGIKEPQNIIWRDSPFGGALAVSSIKKLPGQFRVPLWVPLWDQLWDQLWVQLVDKLGDKLGDQLWVQLGAQFRLQFRDQLWLQLRDQLRDQLGDELRDQVDPWYEGYWSAMYEAAVSISEIKNERLGKISTAIDSAGWWWPMEDTVVITDRPTTIRIESAAGAKRLHCGDGPAISYADGYSLWAWHGTRVPEDLIMKGWDIKRILQEKNSEIRRCAIERMGWDEFVKSAGLQQVGSEIDDPGNAGKKIALYDVPERIYGDMDVRVLLCTNGTRERDGNQRRFGLTVPAHIDSPLAAAGWGYGLTPEEYAQAQRRT